jgi:atypical dual specificity phosphatase
VSRSVTIAIAYIMTCTELSFPDAMNAVKGARKIANPNFGFQRQLLNYELTAVKTARWRLRKNIGPSKYDDEKVCRDNIEDYWKQFDK